MERHLALSLVAGAAALSASLSPAEAAPSRPNVLFIIADDLNTDLGCYGHPVVKTPNIDRLAARGVRFDQSHCQWPLCVPSRASLLSGKRPDGRFANAVPPDTYLPDAVFLPEQFRKNGYFTGRVGKLFHAFKIQKWEPKEVDVAKCWDVSELGTSAVDPGGYIEVYASAPKYSGAYPELQKNVAERELIRKRGEPTSDGWLEKVELDVPDDATSDGTIARRISDLMAEESKAKKPFFLAAGFRRPHLLFAAPKQYFDHYPADKIQLPQEPAEHLKHIPRPALTYNPEAPPLEASKQRDAVAAYYACISFMDAQVGKLLDTMDRLKLWDNTIVVFTSDHGYHLGEHGGLFGKVTLFEEATRVPLIIAAPGLKPGASPREVELLDVYPTLTQLAGLPTPAGLDGTSLVPLLRQPSAPSGRAAYSVLRRGKVWGRSIRTSDYRYSNWDNGELGEELYDHRVDPRELNNLAADPAHSQIKQSLRALLEAHLPKLAAREDSGINVAD